MLNCMALNGSAGQIVPGEKDPSKKKPTIEMAGFGVNALRNRSNSVRIHSNQESIMSSMWEKAALSFLPAIASFTFSM